MSEQFRRQSRVFKQETMKMPVFMVGAGSLGSYAAYTFAKLGLDHFHVYDNDLVELHNTPNQLFNHRDIGAHKVVALDNYLHHVNGDINAQMIAEHYQENVRIPEGHIVISAADSMAVRKQVYEHTPDSCLLIDLRSGTEKGDVFFVDMKDKQNRTYYENFLFSDEEASEESCTLQSVGYSSMLIAGLAVDGFLRFVNDEDMPYSIVCDFKYFDFTPTWASMVK